jgi:hypothetical protein
MLAVVAMLTLTPAVRAEDLSDGGKPMGMQMQEMHQMMHQVMDGTMTPMEMHDKMHQMMDGTAMSMEMHEMMHDMMDGTMTPMEMHEMMHDMMDGTMLLPATGAPAGPVLVLLTALGLIGLGVLSRLGGQSVTIRYGNRPN